MILAQYLLLQTVSLEKGELLAQSYRDTLRSLLSWTLLSSF